MPKPTAELPPPFFADDDHGREILEQARTSDFPAFVQACRASPEANDGPWHLLVDAQGKVHCGAPWDGGPLRVLAEPGAGEAGQSAREKACRQLAGAFARPEEGRAGAARVDCWNDVGELEDWLGAQGSTAESLEYVLPEELGAMALAAPPPPLAPPLPTARTVPEPQPPFTASYAQLRILRSHVVNLTQGKLSSDGTMTSDEDQLREIAGEITAFAGNAPAKVVLFAHGGLVAEKSGLASAWAYREWWKENGIYPVYFVWETGLMETLYRLLSFEPRPAGRGPGDVLTELADKAIEVAARPLAKPIWAAMKSSAKAAGSAGGGARRFAEILGAATGGNIELHGIGHSAGSILLAHLLDALDDNRLKLAQLHLLAPAIATADFTRLAEKRLADWGTEVNMFALAAEAEKADTCADVYGKSLLYLVSNALEDQRRQPLVGLQEYFDSWPGRAMVASHFGPVSSPKDRRKATSSSSHGGFDDDAPTMESVVLRILGADGSQPPECRFPERAPRLAPPAASPPNFYGIAPETIRNAPCRARPRLESEPVASTRVSPFTAPLAAGTGTRRALCFGNNAFSGAPRLSGCINDAHAWGRALAPHGFSIETFLDCPADQMREVIRHNAQSCSPGDVLVIHISSHGTQIDDRDGDELDDTVARDTLDEATLGTDYDMGGLIIDDEWPGLIAVKPGVRVIRFHDFCNSGRTSRMALYGNRRIRGVRTGDEVARRAVARGPARGFDPVGESVPYLTFCACRPDQLAEEDGTMGIFSGIATELLAGAGAAMTARQFEAAIAARMDRFIQVPSLEGPDALRDLPLFGVQ